MTNLSLSFWSKVQRSPSGCWLWTGSLNPFGYGRKLWNSSIHLAHRLAWLLTHGPIPEGSCVLHSCDTPACVRPDHLFLGNRATNTADMRSKGRAANPFQRKLTFELATELCHQHDAGVSGYRLAASYGVSVSHLYRLLQRRSWGGQSIAS